MGKKWIYLLLLLFMVLQLPIVAKGKKEKEFDLDLPAIPVLKVESETTSPSKRIAECEKQLASMKIKPQIASNADLPDPQNYHCDTIAWNEALNDGHDPRGQNGEMWDGNKETVQQIYDHYPDNRYDKPPENTKGFGFYQESPDDSVTHLEYYKNTDKDPVNYIRCKTNGTKEPVETKWKMSRTTRWTFLVLSEL